MAGASLMGNISKMVTLFHVYIMRGVGARVGIAIMARSTLGAILTVQIHLRFQSPHKALLVPNVIIRGYIITKVSLYFLVRGAGIVKACSVAVGC